MSFLYAQTEDLIMREYLITFSYREHGENLFGCATYIGETLADAKAEFRKEFATEWLRIEQIQVLQTIKQGGSYDGFTNKKYA